LKSWLEATARWRARGLPISIRRWRRSLAPLPFMRAPAFLQYRKPSHDMLFTSMRECRVRFTEIDLYGVYVAPMSIMMVAAWVITIILRRSAARFGLLRYVWHPALFVFAVYMIVLCSMVLVIAR